MKIITELLTQNSGAGKTHIGHRRLLSAVLPEETHYLFPIRVYRLPKLRDCITTRSSRVTGPGLEAGTHVSRSSNTDHGQLHRRSVFDT